jgi:hypothetical protein
MCHLDVPRLHFSGRFFTDPSTVNNDPTHYDPANTRPSPWQEPRGRHWFRLVDCFVRSARDALGVTPASDPVIGAPLESTDTPSPAKIVDLDVYVQGVPTIFGLELRLPLPDGKAIVGTVERPTLNDVWFNAVLPTRGWNESYGAGTYGGDGNAAGAFQTIVRCPVEQWPESIGSDLLDQLRRRAVVRDGHVLLSLKFVLDGYDNVPRHPDCRYGRIVGSLGPARPGEAVGVPGPRWLRPRSMPEDAPWYVPSFGGAPFKLDHERRALVVDLANSLCRQSAGGDPVDLGRLEAVVRADGQTHVLGALDYSAFAYDNNAQVAELSLTDEQVQLLANRPLVLVMSRDDLGPREILSEAPNGLAFGVEERVHRLPGTPGTSAKTRVHVTQWGHPPPAPPTLGVLVESVHGNTPGATVPPSNPGDTPQADGALEATVGPVDAQGFAEIALTVVKDPGSRTPELDGQAYFVVVYDTAEPPPDPKAGPPAQARMLSCLVWSDYRACTDPTWEEVRAIMAPYMKLYPYMHEAMDLTHQPTFDLFTKNPPWSVGYGVPEKDGFGAGAIPFYMTRDFDDPRYMPVTRDLSPAKAETVLNYMRNLQKSK